MKTTYTQFRFGKYYLKTFVWFLLGAFLAALGIEVILIPNQLIDGGVIGVSIMASHLFGKGLLPYFMVLCNLPFGYMANKQIGRHFVIQMFTAVCLLAIAMALFIWFPVWFQFAPIEFHGDSIEVIVLGGFIIGAGAGLIIRHGGSTDGTEILGILINRQKGYTVGQVILFVNVFVFAAAGFVYGNWH